jgi:hypothetical protein
MVHLHLTRVLDAFKIMRRKLVLWLIILSVALIVRVLPTFPLGISWRMDEYTHRAISLNTLVFWLLLLLAVALAAIEALRRLPSNP